MSSPLTMSRQAGSEKSFSPTINHASTSGDKTLITCCPNGDKSFTVTDRDIIVTFLNTASAADLYRTEELKSFERLKDYAVSLDWRAQSSSSTGGSGRSSDSSNDNSGEEDGEVPEKEDDARQRALRNFLFAGDGDNSTTTTTQPLGCNYANITQLRQAVDSLPIKVKAASRYNGGARLPHVEITVRGTHEEAALVAKYVHGYSVAVTPEHAHILCANGGLLLRKISAACRVSMFVKRQSAESDGASWEAKHKSQFRTSKFLYSSSDDNEDDADESEEEKSDESSSSKAEEEEAREDAEEEETEEAVATSSNPKSEWAGADDDDDENTDCDNTDQLHCTVSIFGFEHLVATAKMLLRETFSVKTFTIREENIGWLLANKGMILKRFQTELSVRCRIALPPKTGESKITQGETTTSTNSGGGKIRICGENATLVDKAAHFFLQRIDRVALRAKNFQHPHHQHNHSITGMGNTHISRFNLFPSVVILRQPSSQHRWERHCFAIAEGPHEEVSLVVQHLLSLSPEATAGSSASSSTSAPSAFATVASGSMAASGGGGSSGSAMSMMQFSTSTGSIGALSPEEEAEFQQLRQQLKEAYEAKNKAREERKKKIAETENAALAKQRREKETSSRSHSGSSTSEAEEEEEGSAVPTKRQPPAPSTVTILETVTYPLSEVQSSFHFLQSNLVLLEDLSGGALLEYNRLENCVLAFGTIPQLHIVDLKIRGGVLPGEVVKRVDLSYFLRAQKRRGNRRPQWVEEACKVPETLKVVVRREDRAEVAEDMVSDGKFILVGQPENVEAASVVLQQAANILVGPVHIDPVSAEEAIAISLLRTMDKAAKRRPMKKKYGEKHGGPSASTTSIRKTDSVNVGVRKPKHERPREHREAHATAQEEAVRTLLLGGQQNSHSSTANTATGTFETATEATTTTTTAQQYLANDRRSFVRKAGASGARDKRVKKLSKEEREHDRQIRAARFLASIRGPDNEWVAGWEEDTATANTVGPEAPAANENSGGCGALGHQGMEYHFSAEKWSTEWDVEE